MGQLEVGAARREGGPPADGPKKSLGVAACTAIVAGNMVGSGFYLSPVAVAPYGNLAILAWIVMGAGAVGCEFASVYSRFGADTTIVELLPRLVPLEDEEVSKDLERAFRKRGIKSQVDTKLEKLEKTENGVRVTGKTSKGEAVSLEAEMLLVAVGRMPYTEGLGLEGSKIKVEKGFIQIDEFQQTAEKGVYAIGDVVPTPLLAHLASKEGIVAVEHMAGDKGVRPINLRLVPNCTYCDPEVASVGLTEAKAKEQGYDVKVGKFPFSASGTARILGEEEGFVKIVADKKYDEILGVHIIGPHATELIAEACVAMQLESTADELGRTRTWLGDARQPHFDEFLAAWTPDP